MPDETLRADLADGSDPAKGAALVAFKQTGTGAMVRTVANKFLDLIDVMDFVDPAQRANILAGTVSASAAVGAAIDEALARNRGGIRIPAGRFLIDSTIAKTISGQAGFAIEGAGMGLTQFLVTAASGNGFNLTTASSGNQWLNVTPSNSLRLANFAVCSTLLNTGTGIRIDGNSVAGAPSASIVLEYVEIRAAAGVNNSAFLIGLHLYDVAGFHANGCRFLVGGLTNLVPNHIKMESSAFGTDMTDLQFSNCVWYYGGKGITAGNRIEGIYLNSCTMVKCDVGVEWICSAESGLFVNGGHYNCLSRNFDLNGLNDFTISGPMCILSGASQQDHIRIQNGNGYTINGYFLAGINGVNVGITPAGYRGGLIEGCSFNNMITGVNLSGAANNTTVGLNSYTNVTNRVVGVGAAGSHVQKRSYAVSALPTLIGGATSENFLVTIPTGVFNARPDVLMVTPNSSGTQDFICSPDLGTATAVQVTVRVVRRDGTNITPGLARFNCVFYGN